MKKIFTSIFLALLATLVINANCSAQGLAERRAIKDYQDGKFSQLRADINSAAGFEVPVNVEWEKLALPGDAENYPADGYWTNIYFTPLIGALKAITQDEMGKAALKEKLKTISITYDEATAPASNYANGLDFASGSLSINFKPWSNADDIKARQEAIQKILEDKL